MIYHSLFLLSIPDELVKEKNEIISKINDLQKEYSTLNLTDEEYEYLKKPLDEKFKNIKNIEDEIKRLSGDNLEVENPTIPISIESKKHEIERSWTLKFLVGFIVIEILFALSELILISAVFKTFVGYNIWNRKKWAAYVVGGLMFPVSLIMGLYWILQEETMFEGFGTILEAIILFVLVIYSWKEYSN